MNATTDNKRAIIRWILFAIAAAAVVMLFRDVFTFMRTSFNDETEDMAHGWIVPLFPIYLLWARRRQLREALADAPSWLGALGVAASLGLLWLGLRGVQVRISQFGFILMLWALPCAVWGRRMGRIVRFPAAFMVFTVPVAFLDIFTVKLRVLAAIVSSALLNGIGIAVTRTGTGLVSTTPGGSFQLDIADPCSGMRSIFALTAVTAAYAYVALSKNWKRWLLFACSFPLAVVGNIARIFLIAVVARFFGQDVATGFYHDYSGYVVFLVALLLMVRIGTWLEKPRKGESPEFDAGGGAPFLRPAQMLPAMAAPIMMAAVSLVLARMPAPILEPQDALVTEWPAEVCGYPARWPVFCQNDQCLYHEIEDEGVVVDAEYSATHKCPKCGGELDFISLGEHTILPKDTRFIRRIYTDGRDHTYTVTMIINGEQRRSIHRPEMCIPAQGFSMDKIESVSANTPDGDRLDMRIILLRPRNSRDAFGYEAYWFVSEDHATDSHLVRILTSVADRALRNRVTRWAMVTIHAPIPRRYDGTPNFEYARDELVKFAAEFSARRHASE